MYVVCFRKGPKFRRRWQKKRIGIVETSQKLFLMDEIKERRKITLVLYHKLFHLRCRHCCWRCLDDVVWYPGSTLLARCAVQSFSTLERLHVEICDVALAVGQLHPDLELLVEHHIIFPKAAWPVIDAQHTLFHLHLVGGATPGNGVVFPLLSARAADRNTAFGKSQAGPRGSRWLGHLVGRGDSTTPGVLRSADTPGMC